jgi:Cu/Ag efflux pump CusA
MRSVSRLLFWAAVLVLACGCTKPEPRLLRIAVDYPNASPQVVDDTLAVPIRSWLNGKSDVESITTISSGGRLETYVVVASTGSENALFQHVRSVLPVITPAFPSDATAPVVELLPVGAIVPVVNPTVIGCLHVEVNLKAVAQCGIPLQTVFSALQEEEAADSTSVADRLERAQAIRVSAPDGREVPLTELAEITIEKQPSHIVTRWPGEVPSGAAQTTLDERIGDLQ